MKAKTIEIHVHNASNVGVFRRLHSCSPLCVLLFFYRIQEYNIDSSLIIAISAIKTIIEHISRDTFPGASVAA